MIWRAPNVLRFVALYAAFWVLSSLAEYRTINVLLQFVTIGVGIAVLSTYRRMAWAALISRHSEQEDHLVLGISCAWVGVLLRSSTIILWRSGILGNDPAEPIGEGLIGMALNSFNYMIVLGGLLHATAPGTRRSVVPRQNWKRLAAGIACSLILFAAFALTPIYERL